MNIRDILHIQEQVRILKLLKYSVYHQEEKYSSSQKWEQQILKKKKNLDCISGNIFRIYQHDNYSGDSQTWYFLL